MANVNWKMASSDIVPSNPHCTFKDSGDDVYAFWKGIQIGQTVFEFEMSHLQSMCDQFQDGWDFILELFYKYNPPREIYISDWHYEVCYDIDNSGSKRIYNVNIIDNILTISKDSFIVNDGVLEQDGVYVKCQYDISNPSLIDNINRDFELGLEICHNVN